MTFPTKSDLIDMSLNDLENALDYLRQRIPQMTKDQYQRFLRLCERQKEAA